MSGIIIDGVDISGCDYALNNTIRGKAHCPNKSMPYAKETSCIECKTKSTKYNFCKHNPNCYYKQLKRLEQENERLKEKIIKLTEENGNSIINRNTAENKLQDTESRLISIQKANTHNLVLLQRRNNTLEEIRELSNINKEWAVFMKPIDRLEKINKIVSEVLNE